MSWAVSEKRYEEWTYASVAIEDVDVIAGVQVVDCTLAVDLKRVCVHDQPLFNTQHAVSAYARPS
jgi:hypothetical protein